MLESLTSRSPAIHPYLCIRQAGTSDLAEDGPPRTSGLNESSTRRHSCRRTSYTKWAAVGSSKRSIEILKTGVAAREPVVSLHAHIN